MRSLQTEIPMKPGSALSFVLMLLVALGHACRLLLHVDITAGSIVVPAWASVVGIVVPLCIALLLWRERPARGAG
jgi:hypothetical protein